MSKPQNRNPSDPSLTGSGDRSNSQPVESPMPWAMDQSLDTKLGLDASHGDAPAKRRVSQGVVVLLIVLVVAAAALFIMRKTGQARISLTANNAEKQIEIALAQLSGNPVTGTDALLQNTDQVIARFADDPTARQVDLDHVSKNPFLLTLTSRPTADDTQPVMTVNVEDRSKQQRLNQLRSELSKLQLQSVMDGRTPLAVISNKVVRAGDAIGSFRVAAIETRAVTLTADGNSYQLTMQAPQLGGQ